MIKDIEFEEALKDSPKFQYEMQRAENEIHNLEQQTEKIVKICSNLVESGKAHQHSLQSFVRGLNEISMSFNNDAFVKSTFKKFADIMKELANHESKLNDQTNRTVKVQLGNFVKEESKATTEMKKAYDKGYEDYQAILHKHLLKSQEADHNSTYDELQSQKSSFQQASIDYVYQLNTLRRKERLQTVEKMFTYMQAVQAYYHQGWNLMQEIQGDMKGLHKKLDDLSKEEREKKEKMSKDKTRYKRPKLDNGIYQTLEADDDIVIEGYLHKRASNAFKTWNRRWFSIRNKKLFYQKRTDEESTVAIDDVRLCTTRPTDESVDRRNCFEIISPGKSFMLQADNEHTRDEWMKAIQSSIGAAFKSPKDNSPKVKLPSRHNSSASSSSPSSTPSIQSKPNNKQTNVLPQCNAPTTSSPKSDKKRRDDVTNNSSGNVVKLQENISFLEGSCNYDVITQIYKIAGNQNCADCGRAEPRWASLSLGIVLCIDCSGVHRSMGVHISKVRSLTLDQWEPEILKMMTKLGNELVNEIYLSNLSAFNVRPITKHCTSAERQSFIRSKYVERKFVITLPSLMERHNKSVKSMTSSSETTTSTSQGGEDSGGEKMATKWAVSNKKFLREKLQELIEKQDAARSRLTVDNNGDGYVSDSDVIVFGQPANLASIKCRDYDEKDVCDISRLDANLLFTKAAAVGNFPVMLLAKGNGADVNWKDCYDEDGKTPLMNATAAGCSVTNEYLLLNGAKPNILDKNSRSALHHAVLHHHTGIVVQLIKKKINLDMKDANGESALEVAIEGKDADIVTLIRLKKLDNEMDETTNDQMVADVFRDFSQHSQLQRNESFNEKFSLISGRGIATFNLNNPSQDASLDGGKESSV